MRTFVWYCTRLTRGGVAECCDWTVCVPPTCWWARVPANTNTLEQSLLVNVNCLAVHGSHHLGGHSWTSWISSKHCFQLISCIYSVSTIKGGIMQKHNVTTFAGFSKSSQSDWRKMFSKELRNVDRIKYLKKIQFAFQSWYPKYQRQNSKTP